MTWVPSHVIRHMLGHMGHTGVGMRWTCHLLHRIFRHCWQNLQLCGAGHARVDEVLIDQRRARPAFMWGPGYQGNLAMPKVALHLQDSLHAVGMPHTWTANVSDSALKNGLITLATFCTSSLHRANSSCKYQKLDTRCCTGHIPQVSHFFGTQLLEAFHNSFWANQDVARYNWLDIHKSKR